MINKSYHVLNKKNLFIILFAVLLLIPVLLPLFHKGFFVTDDGDWMIIRLSAFFASFKDGQIPVRTLGRLNFGYGYPAATFLYPGIMYLGSVIHLFKIGFIDSIKIIFALSLAGSFAFTYLWLRQYFYKFASFFGALFYLYLPYHVYDVYVRGSVGEVYALLWVPFILWNIERENLFLSSLGIAFLFLAHNTLALLFLPVVIIYILIKVFNTTENRRRYLYRYILTLGLGVGISAFFLMPAIFELSLTQFSKTVISNPFYNFAEPNLLGYISLMTTVVTAVVLYKAKKIRYNSTAIFFILAGVLSLFLSSRYSYILWKTIPASFIQFPFRILSISLISISFLAAFVVSNLYGIYKKLFIFISIILLCLSTYQYTNSVKYTDKGEGFFLTNDATTTVKDEYMPVWVIEKPFKSSGKKVQIVKGKGRIDELFYNNKKISFVTDLSSASVVQINSIYWPGWVVKVDGKYKKILYNNSRGLMQLDVTAGNHNVILIFGEDRLRLFADLISVFSLLLLILICKFKQQSFKL